MVIKTGLYYQRKQQNLCVDCGKNIPKSGFVRCETCLEIRRTRWHERIEKGICPKCGGPLADGKRRCETCTTKNRERRRKLIQKRRENSLCIFCGKNLVKLPFTICEPCRIKKRKREGTKRLDGGSREEVFVRDGFHCRLCDGTRQLRVHHIDGSAETDEPNHNLDNLITLCLPCHNHLHAMALFCKDLALLLDLIRELQS